MNAVKKTDVPEPGMETLLQELRSKLNESLLLVETALDAWRESRLTEAGEALTHATENLKAAAAGLRK